MSLPSSTPDNPEETEIDRLLRELGIELPDENSEPDWDHAAVGNGETPLITDDPGLPDADEPVSYWLLHLPHRKPPWPPETES